MKELPEKIHMLELTLSNVCNSKCLMCDIGTEKFKRKEMSIAEIENVIDSEIAKRANVISLCGGEPFLRKDFVDIVRLIRKRLDKKFNLNVSSNGMDTEKIVGDVEKIVDDVNLVLVFSLDGLQKTHDSQRGVSGAFIRTMNTVSEVTKRFPQVEINLHMTITPLNYKEVYDTYLSSKEHGLVFRASFAHNVYNLTNFVREKNPFCTFTEEQVSVISNQLKKISKDLMEKGNFADALFFNQIPARMNNPSHRFTRCFTSSNLILIKENGDVVICVMSPPVGNINKDSLDNLFLSKKAENVRKKAADLACPNCMMLCGSYFNYEAIGKIYSEFQRREKSDIVPLIELSDEQGKTVMRDIKEHNNKINRPIAPCMFSMEDRKVINCLNPPTSCRDCNELFVDKGGTISICEALMRLGFGYGIPVHEVKNLNKKKQCYASCNPFLRSRCFCPKNVK